MYYYKRNIKLYLYLFLSLSLSAPPLLLSHTHAHTHQSTRLTPTVLPRCSPSKAKMTSANQGQAEKGKGAESAVEGDAWAYERCRGGEVEDSLAAGEREKGFQPAGHASRHLYTPGEKKKRTTKKEPLPLSREQGYVTPPRFRSTFSKVPSAVFVRNYYITDV